MKIPSLSATLLVLATLTFYLYVPSPLIAGEAEETIRFAIISDRTGSHTPGVYEQIVVEVERLKPDFIMTVGDHIEGYSDKTTDEQWTEYREIIKPLSCPIHITPGNHDIFSEASREKFAKQFGAPYRSFDYDDIHIVILDNSRIETWDAIPDEQGKWLEADLKKNRKAEYTLIFFHKPFWLEAVAAGKPDRMHDLFVKYGVDAVFCGHHHTYFSGAFDGIKYTAAGSSGGGTQEDPTGLEYQYIWVTVSDEGVYITPLKMGSAQPWDITTTTDIQLMRKLALSVMKVEGGVNLTEDLTVQPGTVQVMVSNPHNNLTIEDNLIWEAKEGWTITPQTHTVHLAPGETIKADFSLESIGNPYPAPIVSVKFPYAENRKFPVRRMVPLTRPPVLCHLVPDTIIIDGVLNEPCWQSSNDRLFDAQGGASKGEPTSFYFAHSRDNLYLAVKCTESRLDSVKALAKEHDGAVYNDDCIGFFLAPDFSSGYCYQIYFNPSGNCYDARLKINDEGYPVEQDRSWNACYGVTSKKGDDYWLIEACFSLDQFEGYSSGCWNINFRRKQQRLGAISDWLLPMTGSYGKMMME